MMILIGTFLSNGWEPLLSETETQCFAWALIPNHFHLLLKTGITPIATVMKRLLTGYAMYYNRSHNRCGHVFQNRYKSILCQEEAYLLELVRYIHLNPLRAKLVSDLNALSQYPYCGHGVVMGKTSMEWQNTAYVLGFFDSRLSAARRRYRDFVQKGIAVGKKRELTGGGLVRSAGGWSAVKSLRKTGALQKGDERILGDGEFVESVLSQAKEAFEEKYRLMAEGGDVDGIAERVAEIVGIPPSEIWRPGKHPQRVLARDLLCYWATSRLGTTQAWLSTKLGLSQPAISLSVERGRQVINKKKYSLGKL
jgi:hypothetical protein